jgi:hypothetical protein
MLTEFFTFLGGAAVGFILMVLISIWIGERDD